MSASFRRPWSALAPGVRISGEIRLAERGELAEVAVVVADEWQRRGIATLLLRQLSKWARARGIRQWLGVMLGTNEAARAMMRKIATEAERPKAVQGVVEVIYDLER